MTLNNRQLMHWEQRLSEHVVNMNMQIRWHLFVWLSLQLEGLDQSTNNNYGFVNTKIGLHTNFARSGESGGMAATRSVAKL